MKNLTELRTMIHFHGGSYWELWDPGSQDTPDPVDTPGTLGMGPPYQRPQNMGGSFHLLEWHRMVMEALVKNFEEMVTEKHPVPFVTGPLVLQTQNHSVCCFHVLKEKNAKNKQVRSLSTKIPFLTPRKVVHFIHYLPS